MDTLDQMKNKWAKSQGSVPHYEVSDMSRIIRKRVSTHLRESMHYFWASFVLQLVAYALYAHVLIRFIHDPYTAMLAAAGILLYIPFTVVLMRKFKEMAVARPQPENDNASSHAYLLSQRNTLLEFFRFKVRYEWILIPLSSLVGTLLVFKIWVPGGPVESPIGVFATAAITLLCCYLAIRRENNKSFRAPLARLDDLLNEFSEDTQSA